MSLFARLAAPLIIAALSWSLGGCLSSGPATRFYVLTPAVEPQAVTVRVAARPRVVVIKDVRLPRYLDRPQIVTRDAGNSLEWVENEQWGGHLNEDLVRVLAMNLGRLLEGDRVVAAPYPVAKAPDYRVEVEIRSFERQHEGRVELVAQWWITRGSDGSLVADSEQTFLGDAVADRASYDKLVGAMSVAYGELAKAIAHSIRSNQAMDL